MMSSTPSGAAPTGKDEAQPAAQSPLESRPVETLASNHPAPLCGSQLPGLMENAVLAAAGGFLDAFTYIGHGHVFANAMTGNVVLLGINAVGRNWHQSFRHLPPILAFLV